MDLVAEQFAEALSGNIRVFISEDEFMRSPHLRQELIYVKLRDAKIPVNCNWSAATGVGMIARGRRLTREREDCGISASRRLDRRASLRMKHF